MNSNALMWTVAAFVVGAVVPLLGLLAAAFAFGAWWSGSGQPTKCDPQLMSDIKDIERAEHSKLKQRR